MNIVVLVVAGITIEAMLAAGQAPAQKPSFEVASVKPSDPNQRGATIQKFVGGRFVAKGVSLRLLLTYAYSVRTFQILGGPGWIGTDRWDIEGKAEEGSAVALPYVDDPNAADSMPVRLQSLLEDRFQLKLHRESRGLPIYELMMAKSGLKMKLSDDQTPFKIPEPGVALTLPQCGGGIGRYQLRLGRGKMEGCAVELSSFIEDLSQQVGRTIGDKTGLKGLYDINLQWTPDLPAAANPADGASPPIDEPSIFTALQEQLGLRLESAKGPVEVLVIDNVQKPSEN